MQFFASCPRRVADLTAAELRDCGATNAREFRLGVQFEGSLETAYRACLWSRTASRVLLPLATFPAATPEELYAGASSIDWSEHLASAVLESARTILESHQLSHATVQVESTANGRHCAENVTW